MLIPSSMKMSVLCVLPGVLLLYNGYCLGGRNCCYNTSVSDRVLRTLASIGQFVCEVSLKLPVALYRTYS